MEKKNRRLDHQTLNSFLLFESSGTRLQFLHTTSTWWNRCFFPVDAPSSDKSFSNSPSFSALRAHPATVCPRFANSIARARPSPLEAPVISTSLQLPVVKKKKKKKKEEKKKEKEKKKKEKEKKKEKKKTKKEDEEKPRSKQIAISIMKKN